MQYLFFKGKTLGSFSPDEMDPPFGSGMFHAIDSEDLPVIDAQSYLEFTHKEFELSESGKAYAEFERCLECDYGDFYFSNQWQIGETPESAYTILQPMLSREGLLVFQMEE